MSNYEVELQAGLGVTEGTTLFLIYMENQGTNLNKQQAVGTLSTFTALYLPLLRATGLFQRNDDGIVSVIGLMSFVAFII